MWNELGPQLLFSALLISLTSMIHAIFTVLVRPVLKVTEHEPGFWDEVREVAKLVLVALGLIGAHTVSAMMWAGLYLHLGVSETPGDALYFALTTYTTLGFGDVLAPQQWRLLTGFASLNGLLLFGLSAAILVDAATRLRQSK